MKIRSTGKAILSIFAVAVLALPAQAEEKENDFSHKLHIQVFIELKKNVEHLFKSNRVNKPADEMSAGKTGDRYVSGSGFTLPVSRGETVAIAERSREIDQ